MARMGDDGRVVAVTALPTRVAAPNYLLYAMAKSALETMTRTLAKELGPRGITVNAVMPGIVDTEMNASWLRSDETLRRAAAATSVLGCLIEARDAADVVAFLGSDSARTVTSQVLDASGGSTL